MAESYVQELMRQVERRDAEIAKLRAENARLREAMPTDAEIASIGNVAYQARRAGASTTHTDAWLARLDAAKGVG